jgi:hypothetical protein
MSIGVDSVDILGLNLGNSTEATFQDGAAASSAGKEAGAEVVVIRMAPAPVDKGASVDETAAVWAAVARAKPLSPEVDADQEAAKASAARAITDKSVLHAVDLASRQVIAHAMALLLAAAPATTGGADAAAAAAAAPAGLHPGPRRLDSRILSTVLNRERRLLLEELRLGTMPLLTVALLAVASASAVDGNGGARVRGGGGGSGDVEGPVDKLAVLIEPCFLKRCVATLRRLQVAAAVLNSVQDSSQPSAVPPWDPYEASAAILMESLCARQESSSLSRIVPPVGGE